MLESQTVQKGNSECGRAVLVVDDEDAIRNLVCEILKSQGYRVLSASNAEEALRLADASTPIDLLLTDVTLPGINGIDLSQRLTDSRPGLKTLVMSGWMDIVNDEMNAKNLQIAVVHKPFTVGALMDAVRRTELA